MADVAATFRGDVLASLVPLQTTHLTVTAAMTRVEDSKRGITEQGADIATTINQSFDQLHAILEERKQVLLQQVREVVGRKIGALVKQQEDLQLALATLSSLVGFVETTAKNAGDEEFISMKQQLTSRIQQVTSKYRDLKLNLTEVANMFVAVPPSTGLEELCKESAVVDIDGLGIKSATTKQISKFTVCTNDSNGHSPPAQQHVSAELMSLVDGSVLQSTVVSQTLSIYELSYTPTTRGHHQLTVRVNNTEIVTFQVFVHHPPTQLGSPVKVIDGVKGPYYIAVGEKDLFVTEDHRYTILDVWGQRVLTVGSKGNPPFGDEYPLGIATDGDGSVYITSEDHKVQKFSRFGELVKSVGKRGVDAGDFDWPYGIKYHNHKVYVCDSGNGRVQVFDCDFNFIRSFGTHGDGPGQLKKSRDSYGF